MPEDAIKVAPHVYKVVAENERVRVLEARMNPGDRTEMHSHPSMVACAVRGSKFKFTDPSGQSMEVEIEAGQAFLFPATDHTTECVGTTEGLILLVELK